MLKFYLFLILILVTLGNVFGKSPDIYYSYNNYNVFQAITTGEKSSDFESYTKKLTEGLSGKADINNNGILTLQELRLFLEIDGLQGDLAKNKQTPKSFIQKDFTIYQTNTEKQKVSALGKTEVINIAIDKYQSSDFPTLSQAVADAKALTDVLAKTDADKKINIRHLINENATRENILNAMNEIAAETIIVYVTGISSDEMFFPYEANRKNLFLAGISTETFTGILKQKKGNVWVISDCQLLWETSISRPPYFKESK